MVTLVVFKLKDLCGLRILLYYKTRDLAKLILWTYQRAEPGHSSCFCPLLSNLDWASQICNFEDLEFFYLSSTQYWSISSNFNADKPWPDWEICTTLFVQFSSCVLFTKEQQLKQQINLDCIYRYKGLGSIKMALR